MSAITHPLDVSGIESALDDLAGVASLLIDASYARDPDQRGVLAAARFLEAIHERITIAVGFEVVGQ